MYRPFHISEGELNQWKLQTGILIRVSREANGISILEMSKLAKVSEKTILDMELGVSMSIASLWKICQILRLPITTYNIVDKQLYKYLLIGTFNGTKFNHEVTLEKPLASIHNIEDILLEYYDTPHGELHIANVIKLPIL